MATCSAWKRRSLSDQRPGRTISGRHAAELAGDRLAQPRLTGHPARAALVARAEDDRVVRGGASRDVDRGDAGMLGEEGACRCPAGDDANEVAPDERREDPLEHRQERLEHRAELEHRDAVLGEQLVDDVERRDRRHVAGAQDQRDAMGVLGGPLGQARRRPGLLAADPGLHPHRRGVAGKQEPVEHPVRQHLDRHPPARRCAHPVPRQRASARHERIQRLAERGQGGQERVRAGYPFLADERRRGIETLDATGLLHPATGLARGGLTELQQQLAARRERGAGPGPLPAAQLADRTVERVADVDAERRGHATTVGRAVGRVVPTGLSRRVGAGHADAVAGVLSTSTPAAITSCAARSPELIAPSM